MNIFRSIISKSLLEYMVVIIGWLAQSMFVRLRSLGSNDAPEACRTDVQALGIHHKKGHHRGIGRTI